MTCLIAVVLTTVELHNLNLFVTTMAHDFSSDRATLYNRCTNLHISAFTNHEHLVKFDRIPSGHFKLFKLEDFAFFNAVLLSTANNYCVHVYFLPVSLLAV